MKIIHFVIVCLLSTLGLASPAHASDSKDIALAYSGDATPTSPALAAADKPFVVAYVWTCRADSPYGSWGEGIGNTRGEAANNAMYYCRVNTPYGYYCFITSCG